MIRNGTKLGHKAIALAASAALAAGSIVATASTATAAPGDVTQFPLGDSTNGIAEGPAGNLWVTVENGVIAKVSLDGTSIGYQTNTLVYGAGNYTFVDFLKIGVPMNVITGLAAILVIPVFFPM